MATMAREAWPDERLDDLKATVDAGFGDMRAEFRVMREELRAGREEMREELRNGREEMREELKAWRDETRAELKIERAESVGRYARIDNDMREIRAELASLNRTIHQFMFAIVGTIFLGFMGTISALVTLT
jgi:uncharacterized protein (DUF3084 family)